jgi:hypothetical protein
VGSALRISAAFPASVGVSGRSSTSTSSYEVSEDEVDGTTQTRLLFGRFLDSATSGSQTQIPTNLTERRFRSYWECPQPQNQPTG